MQCELCGKEGETKAVLIEGIEMSVCGTCERHGQILRKPIFVEKSRRAVEEPEKIVVSEYARIIKQKREALGLKQEEFAKLLNEKTSTMISIESGNIKPTLNLCEKLKKKFGLKLIEEIKNTKIKLEKPKSEGLTIGDLLKK